MATTSEALPNETNNFASDLAGIPSFLIDPESAARRVRSRWFWIGPLLISMIIAVAATKYFTPYAIHAAVVSPPPDGRTTAQQVEMIGVAMKFQSYLSPVFIVMIYAIEALILLGMSAMLGTSARFGQLFNLIAGCGVIQSLVFVASAVILHFKGEVNSMAELRPAMGPDIFMPEGTNKYLVALGSAFSIFQLWWLVMMILIFAAAFKVSKGKSSIAILPLWLVGVGFAFLGAAFQR